MEAGLKIKLVFVDGLSDGRSDEQIDRQTEPDAVADFGGGNAQGETAQLAAAEGWGQRLFGFAWARDDDELGALGQFGGVSPLGQHGGVIGADEIEERSVRVAAGVVADGEDGVGDTAAEQFLVIDGALGLAGQGEAEEAEAFLRRGENGFRFEGGLRGGDEEEPVQGEFFPGGLGHEEMSEVNRVEGTAVEPDFVHGVRVAGGVRFGDGKRRGAETQNQLYKGGWSCKGADQ